MLASAEGSHGLQLVRVEVAMPSAEWIEAFVTQMGRLGARLPPAAIAARAEQLWSDHWGDDPMQTALDVAERARI